MNNKDMKEDHIRRVEREVIKRAIKLFHSSQDYPDQTGNKTLKHLMNATELLINLVHEEKADQWEKEDALDNR